MRILTLLMLTLPASAADLVATVAPPKIDMPSATVTTVKTETTPQVLTPTAQFIVNSNVPLLVYASDETLVKIVEEKGPLRIRGEFIDAPGKVQSRTFPGPWVYLVEPVKDGDTVLFVQPIGAKAVKDIQRRSLTVRMGQGPKPPPPSPVPPVPPVPPGPSPAPPQPPAPIPGDGLRVLIVYESAELAKYPAAQADAIYSAEVRGYLNAKCPKGPDGKTAEWRMFDKDVDLAGESSLWKDAMKRPRGTLPTIIVSNGKAGFEGPLPPDTASLMALLKKYGE